ncbi:hypothetical protein B0H14DRAFT_2572422 [Mycena olivaceomarginata]|nr:hypothetical protein B0H14DRAFT_2572422 [Mycena olivaceomarginata]
MPLGSPQLAPGTALGKKARLLDKQVTNVIDRHLVPFIDRIEDQAGVGARGDPDLPLHVVAINDETAALPATVPDTMLSSSLSPNRSLPSMKVEQAAAVRRYEQTRIAADLVFRTKRGVQLAPGASNGPADIILTHRASPAEVSMDAVVRYELQGLREETLERLRKAAGGCTKPPGPQTLKPPKLSTCLRKDVRLPHGSGLPFSDSGNVEGSVASDLVPETDSGIQSLNFPSA